ncbi:MAG: PEP-CTERM sorting domain-containing protein [Planctomycetota bacterium]
MLRTIALVIALIGSVAHGQLTMKIDSSNQTFWFEGTDNVTFADQFFDGGLRWGTSSSVGGFERYTTGSLWTGTNGSPGGAFDSGHTDILLDATLTNLGIRFGNSTSGANTISGTGMANAASYGGLSAAAQTVFEGFAGQSLTVTQGSGNNLMIMDANAAAIPEPSSFLSLGLLSVCVGGFGWYRKRSTLLGMI